MMHVPPHQNQRRSRTGLSCLICRKKKIKCDKQKPVCGGCVTRGRAHLCYYDTVNESNTNTNDANNKNGYSNSGIHIKPSKYQALLCRKSPSTTSPHTDSEQGDGLDDEYIDFYLNSYHSPVTLTQGSLSWVSLLRKDVYLNTVGLSSDTAKTILTKNTKSRANTVNFDDKFWDNLRTQRLDSILVFSGSGLHDDFISKVKATLTDGKLIWLLVDRFWSSDISLMYSFISYAEFTSQLVGIIGERSYGPIELNLTKRSDIITVGTLLLIMRMSSLSLYNFGKPIYGPIDEDVQYLIDHPITESVSRLIEQIYSQLSVFRSPRIDALQFMLLKSCYETMAPESCDCVSCSSLLSIGKLLQYAIHCSLNRDPTTLKNITENDDKNLLRRMWYEILHIDTCQLVLVGTPTIIHPKFFDTHLPHVDESKDEYDTIVNQYTTDRSKFFEYILPVLDLVLNIRKKPKISAVKEALEPLEKLASGMKTIKEIIQSPDLGRLAKSEKLRASYALVDSHAVIFMIYYHFFLFYNHKKAKESSLHYLLELLKASVKLYEGVLFLDPHNTEYDCQKHFGTAIFFFPKIELSLHRITLLVMGIMLRIKALKMLSPNGIELELSIVLDRIVEIATRIITTIMTSSIHVSDMYYHPWISSKIESFILIRMAKVPRGTHYGPVTTLLDIEFLENLKRSKHNDDMFERYTTDDFKAILEILEKMDEISSKFKLRIQGERFLNSPHWGQNSIAISDKKWVEKMIDDFADTDGDSLARPPSASTLKQNDIEHDDINYATRLSKNLDDIANNTQPEVPEQVPQQEMVDPETILGSDTFYNDFGYVENINELIGANIDSFNFEKMFYYGGSDKNFL